MAETLTIQAARRVSLTVESHAISLGAGGGQTLLALPEQRHVGALIAQPKIELAAGGPPGPPGPPGADPVWGYIAGTLASQTDLQIALDGKAPLVHGHVATDISDSTAAGRAMLKAASAAAQTALLDTATQSLKGLMAGNDKKKLDSRPYASLFDAIDAGEWPAIKAGTSTLDVSGHIQAAIDAGVAIVVPEGTFMLGAAIKFKSGTVLRAMGAANRAVFKALAAMTAPVLGDVNDLSDGTNVFAQSNILIDGITFDGGSRTISSDAALLRFYSVDGLTLRDCTFKNQLYSLVAIGGCRDVSLSGLKFRNWGKTAVTAEGGPALWLGGNTVGGDDTVSSRIRGYDLDFTGGEWAAVYDFSSDSEFFGVNIEDVKEAGFYYQGNWSGNTTADSQPRRHLYSGLNIKGVTRKNISSAGLEIAGDSCAVSNFNISDTEDAGLKIAMLSRNVSVSQGHIWDTVLAGDSGHPNYFATYDTYGQITLIQAEDIVNHDVSITGVTVGRTDVAAVADYALRIFNNNPTPALYWQHLEIAGNNFAHGYSVSAISAQAGALDPADTVSAICRNIGAADVLNPFRYLETLDLGHASDTTLTRSSAGVLAVEGVTVPLNSTTNVHTAQQIELGHASDTTLTRSSAGVMAVEGGIVPKENRANTFSANQSILVTDNTNAALKITQLGTGHAIMIEDETSVDATPFWVNNAGQLVIGHTSVLAVGGASHLSNFMSTGANYPLTIGYTGASALGARLALVKSRGADWSTRGLASSGDVVGALTFAADDGTDLASVAAAITVSLDAATGTDDVPGKIVFSTTADGGNAPTDRLKIDSTGAILNISGGGLGYGTGSGGAVTQATSRTTGVTLNKTNGAITLVAAAGSTAWNTFTVTNNTVAATDTIVISQKSGANLYEIHITAVAAGSFNVSFRTTGGTTTEQPVFNFAVIKAATA